jgi:A/G-specific adenine glycosylase
LLHSIGRARKAIPSEKQKVLIEQANEIDSLYQFMCKETKDFLSGNHLTDAGIVWFRELIYRYYRDHRRDFAWRKTTVPYHIVVSEIMLQQTQTSRVIEKYAQFIATFSDFHALAHASPRDVLTAWSGLGYNRRGLALHAIAQRVTAEYAGILPADPIILESFRGIGPNTAGSIAAFAFNIPTVFIETNIRAVFIHTFFHGRADKIKDQELLPLVEQTVDKNNAREWYYALMDYGVMLKKQFVNPSRKSQSYHRQSKFEGSERQIRGAIIKLLTQFSTLSFNQLIEFIKQEPERIQKNLEDLRNERLVQKKDEHYFL